MDYISALNQICQKSGITAEYITSKSGSSDHLPIWTVELTLTSGETTRRFLSDEAGNSKEAKKQVARKAFESMKIPEKVDSLNYVGEVNAFCQKKGITPPASNKVQQGDDWKVQLTLKVNGKTYTSEGVSRVVKDAKQVASQALLEKIKDLTVTPKNKGVDLTTIPEDDFSESIERRVNLLSYDFDPNYLPKVPAKLLTNKTCKCSFSPDFLPNVIIFIDADNVPTEACLHYRCRTICYLGKMTAFPPKKYAEVPLCSNAELTRCTWHSSDAVDVLLAMELGMLGKAQNTPKCIIISKDKIMQSVCSSALYLGIDAEWHLQTPEEYLFCS